MLRRSALEVVLFVGTELEGSGQDELAAPSGSGSVMASHQWAKPARSRLTLSNSGTPSHALSTWRRAVWGVVLPPKH